MYQEDVSILTRKNRARRCLSQQLCSFVKCTVVSGRSSSATNCSLCGSGEQIANFTWT